MNIITKNLRFRCKKSGHFTKQVKNFTNRQFNHSQHPEKWYIKVPIMASKYEDKIFATEPSGFNKDINTVLRKRCENSYE